MKQYTNIELEKFLDRVFDDAKSDKPFSEKIYLHKFNKTYQNDRKYSAYCSNNINYHQNYYGTNNVQITDSGKSCNVCCFF